MSPPHPGPRPRRHEPSCVWPERPCEHGPESPRPPSTTRLGRAAEDRAAEAYRRLGFALVARNVRVGPLELDLILRRGRLLVFCEVRSRSTGRYGDPAQSVDRRKQVRLRAAAARFLATTPSCAGLDVQFDVVSVSPAGLRRFEAAF